MRVVSLTDTCRRLSSGIQNDTTGALLLTEAQTAQR